VPIQAQDSPVEIMVVRTDEEIEIALQTAGLLER
jgi:acetate kinase